MPIPATTSRSPLASAAFRRLVYVQACFGLAFATFMILPKYLALRGVGPGRLSLIMGTASLINVVSAPLVTWLGRHFPTRTSLVLGNVVMAVGAAGFVLVDPASPGPLPFLLRLVQGLAWALVFSTASLMAMNLAPRGRLGQAIALQSSANLAAGALAPALAEPALAAFGPRPVFLVAAAVSLVAARLAAGLDAGGAQPPPAAGPTARPAGPLLVTSVVLGIACGAMLVLHQPLALARGIDRVSDFLVAYTAGALLVRLGLARVTDRIGAARVAFASFLLYGAVVAAMPGLAPTALVPSLVVFGGLFGVAHGLFWPAFLTLSLGWAGEASPAARQRLLAWINASFNAGVASVGALGLLAEHAGFALVFIPVGALTAASAWLLRRWTRQQTT